VFPTSSFAHAHDLKPELASKLKECFYSFRFPPAMQKEFNGDDRFLPISYAKDWAVVRDVAEKSGTPYNKARLRGRGQARGRGRRQACGTRN
jgi:phosphonate transport system substrate-binding protein